MSRGEQVVAALETAARDRILLLDGAMGTMIQAETLTEEDFRGQQFVGHNCGLKGNNDLLNITQPETILAIHTGFLEAGADIILTNTFNSTSISQADYEMEAAVPHINRHAANVARAAVDAVSTDDHPRFVAGSLGPTNKTASISPDVSDPGFRGIDFDTLRIAYKEQAGELMEGGVDLFVLETIFDTLNAKAALFALSELFDEVGDTLPVLISGTVTDLSGRTLTGQTPEAFWYSVRHANPFSVGLNCSFGAEHMRPFIDELSRSANALICAYPNAGLPNEFGEYDETPDITAKHLGEWAEAGLVNMVGGCCGTTPDHIRAIADAIAGKPPRVIPDLPRHLRLSGLEPLTVRS